MTWVQAIFCIINALQKYRIGTQHRQILNIDLDQDRVKENLIGTSLVTDLAHN